MMNILKDFVMHLKLHSRTEL